MRKIFLSLVAAISAVTLMAQTLPTACDAQIEFKYCFTTYGSDAKEVYSFALPYTWNGVTFPADGTYPMMKQATITNVRGCDSILTMTLSMKEPPTGSAGGKKAKLFTVGEGKQVFFSQGNLQYRPTADGTGSDLTRKCADSTIQYGIFRFAENQYDYVGAVGTYADNYMPGNVYYQNGSSQTKCDNNSCNRYYKGFTDLFAWGTSGYNNLYPYAWIDSPYSYYGVLYDINSISNTNYDWGVYNPISNGGNKPGQWRTLSNSEWYYLIFERTNATSKVAKATITDGSNTVASGLIILPDEWDQSKVSVTVNTGNSGSTGTAPLKTLTLNSTQNAWNYNTFTLTQWAILEQAGVVFLPAAGKHYGNTTYYSPEGHYYTTTGHLYSNSTCGDEFQINNSWNQAIRICQTNLFAQLRASVRLVADK